MAFEYRKLKGRIVEKVGSQNALAAILGISEVAFCRKMTGDTRFSTDDIVAIAKILDIPKEELGEYFFTPRVKEV